MDAGGGLTKAHCNKCQGETFHDVLHTEKTEWRDELDDDYAIYGSDLYHMLQCRGCRGVRLRHMSFMSENDEPDTYFYPPATARRVPPWIHQISDPLDFSGRHPVEEMLREIYAAVQNGSLWLACIGVRSLIEHMMIEKVGDHGSFAKNMGAFRTAGYVSTVQAAYVEAALEAGHASTHRGWRPTLIELGRLMDITDSIVESVYVLPRKMGELKTVVPPRQ